MYVRELMTAKVVTVEPTDTLAAARRQLQENRIHHLIVTLLGEVVGIVAYRDLIGRDDKESVADVMSRDIVTVEPWDTVRNAASLMIGRTHGCLPVIERGKVTGIITTTDLLRAVSSRTPKAAHA